MKTLRMVLFGIIVFSMLSSSAIAGVYMSGTSKSSAKAKAEMMKIFAEIDRLRMETMTEMGMQIFIFRGDLDKFWAVNNGKYMEMTKEDMKKMGEQMSGAMKMMEEKMEGLTDDQKAMMNKYMKGNMPGQMANQTAPMKTEWKKVGNEKINDWECAKFQSNDGETVWTVELDQVGLTKDDFKVFESVQDFMKEMTKGNDSFLKYTTADDNEGLTGFPVKSISDSWQEHIVNEITKKKLDGNLFELQKEWKKQDSPMMQMQMK